MIALVQRCSEARVLVEGEVVGEIGAGMLVLLGVQEGDDEAELDWLVGKVARLRIFADEAGKLNLSVLEAGGEALVVSQFTLCARTAKGNRPSFVDAAAPAEADRLYGLFAERLGAEIDRPVPTGVFGAGMAVELVNDGPLTIWIDSRHRR